MRPAVFLSHHVTAQCVRDAEKRAGISHDEALGRRVDDDDDEIDTSPRRVDHSISRETRRQIASDTKRAYVVRLSVGDAVHEYRVDGTDPADAAKNARRLHAAAGLPSSTAWRARLA